MTQVCHRHGALAGVELWHGGMHSPNRFSRMAPLSVSGEPLDHAAPIQTRAMDLADIRNLRRWQVDAALRAKEAGFDIVYVYAGHAYLPFQFLSHRSQPADRRLWRAAGEPGAPAARDDRGDEGGGGADHGASRYGWRSTS